ncbi:MAG: hypothetical protein WKF75_06115 [Singulisphaera sp.]
MLMAIFGALLVAVPLGDLASTLWSVRVAHFWYYSRCFARSRNMPDPELIWKRTPGLIWRGRKTPHCDEVVYRTDENGFRNPAVRRADIVVLGDSVTEAGEVEEISTFVRKTGEGTRPEGGQPRDERLRPPAGAGCLEAIRAGLQPRLVVWQVTEWNDLIDAQAYRIRHEPAARTLPPWEKLHARHSPVMRLVSAVLPGRRPNTVEFRGSDERVEEQIFWPYQPDPHRQLPEGSRRPSRRSRRPSRPAGRGASISWCSMSPRACACCSPTCGSRRGPAGSVLPGRSRRSQGDLSHAMAEFCGRLGCPMIDMGPRYAAGPPSTTDAFTSATTPTGGRRTRRSRNALVRFVGSRRELAAGVVARQP